jgi:hypothetical protein
MNMMGKKATNNTENTQQQQVLQTVVRWPRTTPQHLDD